MFTQAIYPNGGGKIMVITAPTVLLPGLTASPTRRGVLSVDLGVECDPETFTQAMLDSEKERLGCVRNPDGAWRLSWKYRQEYLRDFDAQVGKPVFDPAKLMMVSRPAAPIYTMDYEIYHVGEGKWAARITKHLTGGEGPIKVFLDPASVPPMLEGQYFKSVTRSFGIGSDVGEGVEQSDSTLQGFATDNREQAFEFASNQINPTDLGRLAVALAIYFNDALICPVRPMHGVTMLRAILDECKYSRVWRDKSKSQTTQQTASQCGWAKGESSSPWLFGPWIDAIDKGQTILHGLLTIDQHKQYIYGSRGEITQQKLAGVPAEVRNRHGDAVVGCALALRACIDSPQFAKIDRSVDINPFSYEGIIARERQERQAVQPGQGRGY